MNLSIYECAVDRSVPVLQMNSDELTVGSFWPIAVLDGWHGWPGWLAPMIHRLGLDLQGLRHDGCLHDDLFTTCIVMLSYADFMLH